MLPTHNPRTNMMAAANDFAHTLLTQSNILRGSIESMINLRSFSKDILKPVADPPGQQGLAVLCPTQ
jgi:hypothetical protein